MAAPVWPSAVPYETKRSSFAIEKLGGGNIKTPMQSGRTRMRRASTLRITLMRWGRELKTAEMAAFRTFVLTTLGDGTASFTMPVWQAGSNSYVTRTVRIKDGAEGISERETRPGRTEVSMVLEVENL
ncbi:hypothetical protein [Enterovirga sp. CN4-39]|uniref:hypothetical protein n=1 Tax=Enterovirga sp. CN4-39 TaxID=3400910 RepID=UPI003C04181D